MFEFVRKHNRVMQFLLFLLIFPSFVLFGLEGYNRFKDKGDAVARVDGRDITQAEWDAAHRNEVERMRAQMPNLDIKLADSPQAKYSTLERLVRERVLAAAAAKSKLQASDQRLARELAQNQLIASVRGPDGRIDMERYRQATGYQGMSPQMFEESVRNEIGSRQVLMGVGASALAPKSVAGVFLGAYYEQREVQVARFNASDYASKVSPSDADLEAYYKANPQQFQAPEQASVEYVMLDVESLKKGVAVNEQELKTYFEQNQQRLGGKEERRASHILITVNKDAAAAEKDKAKARAEALLAEVKKNPDSFAEVAKKNSQDPGSAAQGGDLDFFTRGAMTKAFEDAVFGMKKGDIVGPVETEFGYHVIRLTDLKTPKVKTFEELRPELEAEVLKQQAQKKYSESVETFNNTVYEQSDSLKPVAEKLKLAIQTATVNGRTPPAGTKGPLANAKFLNALFSPDALEKKRNTEALEVGPSQLVSGRVVQYTPARTRPFAEVKDQVREKLVATRSAELAKKEGEAKLAAWKAAPASATLPAAVVVSRMESQKLPPAIVEAALRADPGALPGFIGVEVPAEGYAVVKVVKTVPREAPAPQVALREQDQIARTVAVAETAAYFEMLKERFKVQMKVPKPAALQ